MKLQPQILNMYQNRFQYTVIIPIKNLSINLLSQSLSVPSPLAKSLFRDNFSWPLKVCSKPEKLLKQSLNTKHIFVRCSIKFLPITYFIPLEFSRSKNNILLCKSILSCERIFLPKSNHQICSIPSPWCITLSGCIKRIQEPT